MTVLTRRPITPREYANLSGLAAYKAALTDPFCLEPLQVEAFSYPIAATETRFVRSARHTRIGSTGKWAVRDMRDARPLRGVTFAGINTDSMAVITDPSLTDDNDPHSTFEERMVAIFESQTYTIGLAISESSKLLAGAYGGSITSICCEDLIWVGADFQATGVALGYTLQEEIRDTESMAVSTTAAVRFGNAIPLGVPYVFNKYTLNRIKAGTAELSGGAGGCCVTWMLFGKDNSKVPALLGEPVFEDDFMTGTRLSDLLWHIRESTRGNLDIDSTHKWGRVKGALVNPWTDGAWSKRAFRLIDQWTFICDSYTEGGFAGSFGGGFGWLDGNGPAVSNMKHCIVPTTSDGAGLRIYENGATVTPNGAGLSLTGNTINAKWEAKSTMRFKVVLTGELAAKYYCQGGTGNAVVNSSTWTLLHTGTPISATSPNVYAGMICQDSGSTNGYWSHPRVYSGAV